MPTAVKKRPAPQSERPLKRHKPNGKSKPTKGHAVKPGPHKKEKEKEKAAQKVTISIPGQDDDDVDLSDQDLDVLEAFGNGASFLKQLDRKGISRSKKETARLHQLNKPVRKAPIEDDLPSIDSNDEDEDEGEWSSGIDDLSGDSEKEDSGDESGSFGDDSDIEMSYETAPRKRRPSWEPEEGQNVQRLPIKLANGRIQETGKKNMPAVVKPPVSDTDESDDEEEVEVRREDISTGARFGRPAVVDVISAKSRKARVQAAKEQIAGICQEIMADPENSLGLLRRLHTFSLVKVSTPLHPDPVPNDPIIRKLAFLSQLAVFKDIIPGYRIRSLTEKEKTENVSQMVARTREWEQGLLVVYQAYLRSLESELKVRSELADAALQCICTLLSEVTHFNFRVNLMSCVVARLSKRSWDDSSRLCLSSLIKVFRADLTGTASLEIVRLLNRMVKEKRYNIRPEVLECLLHLRLKTELGTRASESRADKDAPEKMSKGKGRKGKAGDQPHLSKKAKKVLKEKKEIEKEFREAEAEVDKEERAVTQTETLKLLFVLYFSILKNPRPTPLLPAALNGISKYAHLVNVDFFRDLMKVLKGLILLETSDDVIDDEDDVMKAESLSDEKIIQHRLLCIVTAFELLSGQGEALNIDLSDFITQLYAIIPSLSLTPSIDVSSFSSSSDIRPHKNSTLVDMLFRALGFVFSPRTFGTTAPSWRSAAFAKRLLLASLHWPPSAVLRVLNFVASLITKDSKLEAMLSTDDRSINGVYRPDVEDPQLSNPFGTSFWELYALQNNHWDVRVREEAGKLINLERS